MDGGFFKLGGQDRRRSGNDRRGHSRFLPEDEADGTADERGVLDWLSEEEREDRRSGNDRRSGSERRGSVHNRRDERRVIPFSVAPRGEVRTADGQHWHCSLWDVSRSGLCLVANQSFELTLGCELQVSLYEVVGLGSMFFKAKLRWFASDEFQTYLGLQFTDPDMLPEGTFLERYLQARFET
jgi:hypothetical protein